MERNLRERPSVDCGETAQGNERKENMLRNAFRGKLGIHRGKVILLSHTQRSHHCRLSRHILAAADDKPSKT